MILADRVLFIDAEAIVVDKPAGLPVDAPRDGALSLVNHLDALRFGFERHPLAVHRLDRDTSGCLLLARNPRAHKRFAAAFEAGVVEKIYVAVLDGVPENSDGTIDMPLGKVSTKAAGWRMVADPKGKRAVTHWDLVSVVNGRALIRFRPKTGRTHQLRVHAASGLGVPIAGDPTYGNGVGPMMLHAFSLLVPRDNHPDIHVGAPLPEHFVATGFHFG